MGQGEGGGMSQRWYPRCVLFVRDAEAAFGHYTGALGFKPAWRHDEDGALLVAQVERDGVEIILNRDAERAGHGRVFLSVDPGQGLAVTEAMRAKGADVQLSHWGMPVLCVRDLDGNELLFSDLELGESD